MDPSLVTEIAAWTSTEIRAFFEAFLRSGSNWVAIAAAVHTKSVEQVPPRPSRPSRPSARPPPRLALPCPPLGPIVPISLPDSIIYLFYYFLLDSPCSLSFALGIADSFPSLPPFPPPSPSIPRLFRLYNDFI